MGSTAFALAVLVQTATAAPPPAAASKPFDLSSKLINTPDSNWTVYGPGQSSKRLEKGGPKGYPAFEVSVARASANAWDDGATSTIPKPIGAGDVILVAVYLRNPALADGQSEAIPLVGVIGSLHLIPQSPALLRS